MRVSTAWGAWLPLRANLFIHMFLHRSRSWSLNSCPEEQRLIYLYPSNTTRLWGSGGSALRKSFFNQTIYNAGKCPFGRWERWKEFSMKGNYCPSCPPWMRAEGAATPPAQRPWSLYTNFYKLLNSTFCSTDVVHK